MRDEHVKLLNRCPPKCGFGLLLDASAYVIVPDENCTPAEKDWPKWQRRVKAYLQQVHDYYAFHNQLARWACFGVPDRADRGYRLVGSGKPTIDFFNRHIHLFAGELNESDPRAALDLRFKADELPELLEEAQKKAGLNQKEAAYQCSVLPETYKSAKLRRNKPQGNTLEKLRSFVMQVLLTSE